MYTLTVFTPAYNRAHTLGRTYESLCRQTCKDFEWLVVDDGSTDGTRDLVSGWIAEGKIPIRYIYQENQGMHGAHNTAYHNIDTELNTCIDSDDWMPDDAVEKIITFWREKGSDKYAGIIGLDQSESGQILGTSFPSDVTQTTLQRFYEAGGSGDKKIVLRTNLVKKYPKYPIFGGEKYFSLGYLYLLIGQDYDCLILNAPLVIVEYQDDGSTRNMWRQYWNNPNGFMYLRREHLKYYASFKKRLQTCIHYVSHCIRAKKFSEIFMDSHPFLILLSLPLGVALYFYNKFKVAHLK